jgi:6-phosphogluconolactonase
VTETFPGNVRIPPDATAVAGRAAQELVRIANDAVERSERLTIALAGDSTPKTFYGLLASDPKLRSALRGPCGPG